MCGSGQVATPATGTVDAFTCARTSRLVHHPQFEVLFSVVPLHSVDVMDVLALDQRTAERPLHHKPVLREQLASRLQSNEHIAIASRPSTGWRLGSLAERIGIDRPEVLSAPVVPQAEASQGAGISARLVSPSARHGRPWGPGWQRRRRQRQGRLGHDQNIPRKGSKACSDHRVTRSPVRGGRAPRLHRRWLSLSATALGFSASVSP